MCGIFGLIWRNGSIDAGRARAAAWAMQRALGHRGPDGSGMIERPGLILGHLRLAIIDLAGGAQPMTAHDGKVALSYNGECYNFPELMKGLADAGWTFASRCDSEVLLAGYCLRGETFDETLNGMYAYAILDERNGRTAVQLSTDPVGIKPLFLFQDHEIMVFASELRGIVAALRGLGRSVELEERAVGAYLRHGWVPAPLALLKNARKLEPGERLIIDPTKWTASRVSRRDLPSGQQFAGDERELETELRSRLRAVLRRQTISDVPLGFFLSGGIDSALLLAVATEIGISAKSFTISFVGTGHGVRQADEADVARAVAQHLGTSIDVIEVDADMLRSRIDEALDAMDQPLADPACLPLLLLSQHARREVTVCLSGDGGDELFAGYPRHRLAVAKSHWQRLPVPLRRLARRTSQLLPQAPSNDYRESLRKLRVAHGMLDSPFYVDGPFAEFMPAEPYIGDAWNRNVRASSAELMWADIDGQLAGQMLPKTDNMTMAASLECRVPLLDLDLIELAAGVPLEMKIRGRVGKRPLRRVLSSYLPPAVTERPKQGFRVPLTDWFRGSMADEIRDRLLRAPDAISSHLQPEQVEGIVQDHLSGKAEHSIRLWALLALDRWRERTLASVAA